MVALFWPTVARLVVEFRLERKFAHVETPWYVFRVGYCFKQRLRGLSPDVNTGTTRHHGNSYRSVVPSRLGPSVVDLLLRISVPCDRKHTLPVVCLPSSSVANFWPCRPVQPTEFARTAPSRNQRLFFPSCPTPILRPGRLFRAVAVDPVAWKYCEKRTLCPRRLHWSISVNKLRN